MRVSQQSFSKGEISEELIARFDVASYASGARRARNVVIQKYGGVSKRPGTRLVAECYAGPIVRLAPFQFSLTQTYVLELGEAYMRVAALGGLITEEQLTVQAVTLGTTTTIQADYHGYSVGDQVAFSGIEGATQLNGRIGRVVEVVDSNSFKVDIDSSTFGALTGDSGGVVRTGPPPAPPPPPPPPVPAPAPTPPPVAGGGGSGRRNPYEQIP